VAEFRERAGGLCERSDEMTQETAGHFPPFCPQIYCLGQGVKFLDAAIARPPPSTPSGP
jgi:hypothetical protein